MADSIAQENNKKTDEGQESFNMFWKTFPYHDGHGSFPKSRIIRQNKAAASKAWTVLITSGYDSSMIITALEKEIEMRKQMSNARNGNGLKYMKSPVSWLENKSFLDHQDTDEIINTGDDFE